jgi:hypothetical protein
VTKPKGLVKKVEVQEGKVAPDMDTTVVTSDPEPERMPTIKPVKIAR